MAIRHILQIGNPKLKAENTIVSDFSDPVVKQVIQDMVDTMRETL